MKSPALIPLLLILYSCTGTGHYDTADFDLVTLNRAVAKLYTLPTSGVQIEEQWWPAEIAGLKPNSVSMSNIGIYIEIDSFFVERSGLFIPPPGSKIEIGDHYDPSYRLMGNGNYSYHATG